MKTSILILIVTSFFKFSECIRCFECRSDIQLNCGDPFFGGSVPATECTHINTNPSFMCFKASQYVGGTYITVRGCAPFDSETFNQGMQRQMVGSYWKGLNVFSLCDHDQCNNGNSITTNVVLSALIAIIMQYLF